MIRLASVINQFETDFLRQYGGSLLPSQRAALAAFKSCRTALSAKMAVQCTDCQTTEYVPHCCGHRNCPHCQAHESQQWIARQLAKQLPCDYFMITFTVPQQWRTLVWGHQTTLYDLITKMAWDTANTFSENDKKLQAGLVQQTVQIVAALRRHNLTLLVRRRVGVHVAIARDGSRAGRIQAKGRSTKP